ncbi:hypothetical protein PLESTB_000925600 [Pleodorina starrii]|uniref:RING-type E3 ubiquitin transferase n=1 Tax=Pleodorina starrii TaxID=330485 RepID=A0A9W6BNF3_9CHLO|nr:hypothetical protein PLESTM_001559700 [Pleodorina starrii]GLC54965.1 hypothetical protein PLESTB_000925600 [Pleodorina starrii]GLC68472.1 hypothetical protein PLESTF_000695200 [Pleodorina starrii]
MRFAALRRAAAMDPEHGLGPSLGPSRRNSAQRRLDAGASQLSSQTTTAVSSFGRAVLSFCLVLLVLGVLPATFVFWACIIVVVFTFLRLRVQAQNLQQALEQDELGSRSAARLRVGGSRGPVVRVLPGGGLLLLHTDPHAAMEQLNLQLRQLDEEMGLAGYDYGSPYLRTPHGTAALAAASTGLGPRPPPVSEADIAALPCFTYKPPRGASAPASGGQCPSASEPAAAACSSPASTGTATTAADGCDGKARGSGASSCQQAMISSSPTGTGGAGGSAAQSGLLGPGRFSGGASASSSPTATGAGAGVSEAEGGASSAAAAAHLGLTCPVCLDAVAEGSTVMTLPCLHQFHAACVTPWLRQQGIYATCPMCKTPVFR